jgi:hypothetical protein
VGWIIREVECGGRGPETKPTMNSVDGEGESREVRVVDERNSGHRAQNKMRNRVSKEGTEISQFPISA